MLVLSRQREESIVIGENVEITIVDIRGDKVRLGISAPRDVQVHRKEVFDQIRLENDDASRLNTDQMPPQEIRLRARAGSARSGQGKEEL